MDRMIFGEGAVYSMDSAITGLNNNTIVAGTSGCGKTMSISEPMMLETFDKSLITTVTKRRLVHQYSRMFKERGYEVLDLNFISPGQSMVAYDPMDYLQTTMDISFFAEAIVKSDHEKDDAGEPYWDQAAISLLSAEIALFCGMKTDAERLCGSKKRGTFADGLEQAGLFQPHGRISFHDVLKFHDRLRIYENSGNSGIHTTLDAAFVLAENPRYSRANKFYPFAVSCWKSFCQCADVTAKSIYGTLNTVLDYIFTSELRAMFDLDQHVNFCDLAKRRTVLFVSTSSVNPAMHCMVHLFYAQAFKSLFEFAGSCPGGCLPISVHVLCDDFATGCRIQNFPEYISVFREMRISVTLLIQSESQLEGLYGESDATTIINNCDTYVYMGGMDLQTAASISLRLDAPLDEILYLPIGREIIFRRGQYPLVTERYDIVHDRRYQEVLEQYRKSAEEESCLSA